MGGLWKTFTDFTSWAADCCALFKSKRAHPSGPQFPPCEMEFVPFIFDVIAVLCEAYTGDGVAVSGTQSCLWFAAVTAVFVLAQTGVSSAGSCWCQWGQFLVGTGVLSQEGSWLRPGKNS